MEKKTFEEVIEILKTVYESVSDFAFNGGCDIPEDFQYSESTQKLYDEYLRLENEFTTHPEYRKYRLTKSDEFSRIESAYWDFQSKNNVPECFQIEYLNHLGIGNFTEVNQYGGEGQGDTWYSIKYFPLLDMYIRIDGWYQSYNGTEFNGWEDCSEVKPTEKTIIVYE